MYRQKVFFYRGNLFVCFFLRDNLGIFGELVAMVSGNMFYRRKPSWRADDLVSRSTLQLLDFDDGSPPEYAWRRKISSQANRLKEFNVTFREAIKMMRLGLRLWSYIREEASHGRKAPIDPFTRESDKPSASQGVPLGGMGSGSISRGFRGEFKHWQIIPGSCEMSPVMANQFSIFITRGGNKKYSSVLAPGQHDSLKKSSDDGISSWDWKLRGEPDPELKVSCRQISPFIPHNYQDSSLPTSVFVYTIVNTGKERAKVSLVMTWANSIGGLSHHSGGHVNEPFIGENGVSGVLLHHKTANDNPPVTFAVAACENQNVNVTVLPAFGLSGESSITAREMWGTLIQDGCFDRDNFNAGPSMPSSLGDTVCAAVCASTWVEPHGRCTVVFSLAWSSPKVKFKKGNAYYRRYTKFYGTSPRSAINLVQDALMKYKHWEEEIDKWQSPILHDDRLPEWYKVTVFNELYFLVAGGTVWIDSASLVVDTEEMLNLKIPEDSDSPLHDSTHKSAVPLIGFTPHIIDDRENVGKFLYLEGIEYFMWCTYDVHFYASFALLELFPKIELSIQRDFATAVLREDKSRVRFLADGTWGNRKVIGAVAHDLGAHDPWHELNAYNIHDTSRWKDLNPKFVLQVYRDFAATGDMSFGKDVWPAVCTAMEYMEQFDHDGDGMIENDGFPDQTYDAWTVRGVSAYCGCLWLAALQAAAALARDLGHNDYAERCMVKFAKAKLVFEAKLWNGSYFNYDSGTSYNSRSIHADQLAGQWYTASSGLPPLFDEDRIKCTLQKIFDYNVMRVKGGRMGAVNGMHPNGKVDETCMQSREIWTGVTYSLAATMVLHGMENQAFTTAEGIFIAGWSEEGYGYWFQTPEAWTIDGHYRSLIYMRPLAIWAMQYALSPPRTILEAPRVNTMDRTSHISPSTLQFLQDSVRKMTPRNSCFGSSSSFSCEC
ncbi:non-lysosomal glucosylceramidase-like isoform X2 [Oryza brachyantha]|uniref:non-lysosomal glucosylceramidase-like isoform X2 n=1 Tax=Oryza brachyantha TaxID=4533 RepID=UPI0007769753|nr:non-lysosomal glucosylceramidase-like isoform X2 [Oryza brachyantha]